MDLFVNKYRPTRLEDVVGNVTTIEVLSLIMENADMPHLLFTGVPGSGKTTCAKILAEKIARSKENVLELNASDERGIDTVRTTIKNFARRKVSDGTFKIIILDEADSMTTVAQQAMRRIMEVYSRDCRFVLICNGFAKIFEPIQSRCAILRFDRVEDPIVFRRLKEVSENEGIEIDDDALTLIVSLSDGDMRQSLNILQACAGSDFTISEDYIIKIIGLPSPRFVEEILKELLKGDIEKALNVFDDMWKQKFDPMDIIGSFFRVAKGMENHELLKVVGLANLRIVKGVDSKLQFYGLFKDIIEINR